MTNLFPWVNELFPGSDVVRKYSFKAIFLRNSSALMARANNHLAMNFAGTRGQSALFWEKDCFECIPPRIRKPAT